MKTPETPKMTASKAYIAAIVTALTTFVAMLQAYEGADSMSASDWLIIVMSSLVAGLSVYVVPNKVKQNDVDEPPASESDGEPL